MADLPTSIDTAMRLAEAAQNDDEIAVEAILTEHGDELSTLLGYVIGALNSTLELVEHLTGIDPWEAVHTHASCATTVRLDERALTEHGYSVENYYNGIAPVPGLWVLHGPDGAPLLIDGVGHVTAVRRHAVLEGLRRLACDE